MIAQVCGIYLYTFTPRWTRHKTLNGPWSPTQTLPSKRPNMAASLNIKEKPSLNNGNLSVWDPRPNVIFYQSITFPTGIENINSRQVSPCNQLMFSPFMNFGVKHLFSFLKPLNTLQWGFSNCNNMLPLHVITQTSHLKKIVLGMVLINLKLLRSCEHTSIGCIKKTFFWSSNF